MSSFSSSSTTTSATAVHHYRTYWCYECDMSISLPSFPTPLICPHCRKDFLDQMDSITPTNSIPCPFASLPAGRGATTLTASDDNFLLTSPYLRRLIHHLNSSNSSNNHNRASKSSIDSLDDITVTPALLETDPNLVCPICKDLFQVDVVVKMLPCTHKYHGDCIVPWLEINNSCPVCRHKLPMDKEKYGQGLEDGERYVGFVRLEELVDDEVDLYGFRSTLRHIARRHQGNNNEGNVFSPTQIAGVEREVGVLERENSVEAVSSYPNWHVEGAGAVGGGSDQGNPFVRT